MSEKTVVKNNGISVLGLLGVVFVIFKLLGITAVAGWSWWLVTLPFWIGLGIAVAIFAVAAIGLCVVALVDKLFVK
jgi:hypothetical protein